MMPQEVAMQDNPYRPPSEHEPQPERKSHRLWRKRRSSTVTVLPMWLLLVVMAIVVLIGNLLGTLVKTQQH